MARDDGVGDGGDGGDGRRVKRQRAGLRPRRGMLAVIFALLVPREREEADPYRVRDAGEGASST